VDARGKWYLRSKSYYSFGSSLHSVLQRFHDSGDAGVTTTGEAVAALEESWLEAGYSSQDEMMQAMDEGKAIVERYVEAALSAPARAETLYVEKTLRADLGPFVLLGRLDRVDEHEDGALEVVDYKSGRSGVATEDVATDLAMCCYQLLLRKTHPGRRVFATIHALRAGAQASAELTDTEAEEFEHDLVVLGQEVLTRDYENLAPVGKPLCAGCDFLPLCSRHPDFEPPSGSE
jgi:putative RecB family exonuclease